jgi:hypothetical protein
MVSPVARGEREEAGNEKRDLEQMPDAPILFVT